MILNIVALFNLKMKENSNIIIFIRIGEYTGPWERVFLALSDYSIFSPVDCKKIDAYPKPETSLAQTNNSLHTEYSNGQFCPQLPGSPLRTGNPLAVHNS